MNDAYLLAIAEGIRRAIDDFVSKSQAGYDLDLGSVVAAHDDVLEVGVPADRRVVGRYLDRVGRPVRDRYDLKVAAVACQLPEGSGSTFVS